ncbi:hypothetical protein ONZ43_g958 [Nemania bipapillata]|uniref:Uncharacterized protein n=1 Tax=Nemania bipapillata TaxID=110536 RepID=A0ACC2J6N3_9PEZI|nr:hypothetical protein ONZ43_g958 [Nemania bipapillata]
MEGQGTDGALVPTWMRNVYRGVVAIGNSVGNNLVGNNLVGSNLVGSNLVGSNSVGTAGNRFDRFTLFPHLPTELRLMIWEAAAEQPRFVHMPARGCGITSARRRGIPNGSGPRFRIDGVLYEQVPVLFFVSYEAAWVAVRQYTLRFSVSYQYRHQTEDSFRTETTNLIMGRNDILVSWHTEELWLNDQCEFHIQFGPQASLVRNIMVRPWRTFPVWRTRSYDRRLFYMVGQLMDALGNQHALENIFLLRNRGIAPIMVGASAERPMRILELGPLYLISADHAEWIRQLFLENHLRFWFIDGLDAEPAIVSRELEAVKILILPTPPALPRPRIEILER